MIISYASDTSADISPDMMKLLLVAGEWGVFK